MRFPRYEIGCGVLIAVALVLFAWLSLQVGALRGLGDRVDVTADFPDATGLTEGAFVKVAGVTVGSVSRLELVDGQARVHLRIDPGAGVRADAIASIKAQSVLGEKYVGLEPGASETRLKDGDALAVGARRYEIDDLVNAMGPLVAGLDREAVDAAVKAVSDAIEEDPERLSRMLGNADTTLANVAEASAELPALARDARVTMADARRAIVEVEARAEEAEALVAKADALLDDLEATAEGGPALVEEAHATLTEAREAMARLEGSTADLETLLHNLAAIDEAAVRRLLREEGVLVRIRPPKRDARPAER